MTTNVWQQQPDERMKTSCLVAWRHYSSRPKHFRSRGPSSSNTSCYAVLTGTRQQKGYLEKTADIWHATTGFPAGKPHRKPVVASPNVGCFLQKGKKTSTAWWWPTSSPGRFSLALGKAPWGRGWMMTSYTKSHALIGSCVITFSTLPTGLVLPP